MYIQDWTEDFLTKQYLNNRGEQKEDYDNTDDIVDETLMEKNYDKKTN